MLSALAFISVAGLFSLLGFLVFRGPDLGTFPLSPPLDRQVVHLPDALDTQVDLGAGTGGEGVAEATGFFPPPIPRLNQ
jgi:hypothetical protein